MTELQPTKQKQTKTQRKKDHMKTHRGAPVIVKPKADDNWCAAVGRLRGMIYRPSSLRLILRRSRPGLGWISSKDDIQPSPRLYVKIIR